MSSAPTGLNPYSQGQRPWIGLDVGSALKGRNTSRVMSPFQGSLMIIRIFPGAIPLGFMDSAPLGLYCGVSRTQGSRYAATLGYIT
uniref:Uncharacterized protein n=1 Tax=Candidatus Kentrum sp. DK TaxID=2126562 RepID=A0A450SYV4_9GAMM|nr:MAG: hypothetical protein BECKDK2373B_GA0170837_108017 [Candidatus Kentron sp. DK]